MDENGLFKGNIAHFYLFRMMECDKKRNFLKIKEGICRISANILYERRIRKNAL